MRSTLSYPYTQVPKKIRHHLWVFGYLRVGYLLSFCRVEVDDARFQLVRNVEAKIRFFGGLVTGVAALDSLLVTLAERCGILFLDGDLDLAQHRIVHGFENAAQIHVAGSGLAHWNDAHGPL